MQARKAGNRVDAELIDYVKHLERNPYGWRAVHLHLSQLRPHNRRDYQLRVAASEFDRVLRACQSELFQLSNGDVVLLWEGMSVAEVDKVILRLRYLFSDDPLVTVDEAGSADDPDEETFERIEEGVQPPQFCTWYDLEQDYQTFRFGLEDQIEALAEAAAEAPPVATSEPLDPGKLVRFEQELASIDLADVLRRQPVCVVLPKTTPQPVFDEVHVALSELAKHVMPGVDLTADPWLFQHLAETLDRRMLAGLVEQEAETSEPTAISVNLRLATLLSPEFLAFDHELRRYNRYQVIVELQLIDIYAELGAYLFIREFIRERGYRVCIDGLHHLHLPLVSRRRLGADLVKLIWSPDVLQDGNDARRHELETAIQRSGVDRVILCRCDSADAITWGQDLGIKMFQGHYVDSRIRAARSPAVAAARQALRGSGDGKGKSKGKGRR